MGETEKIPLQRSPCEPTSTKYAAESPFQKIHYSTADFRNIAKDMIRSPGTLTPNHGFEFKARGLRDMCHKWQTFFEKVPNFKPKIKGPGRLR